MICNAFPGVHVALPLAKPVVGLVFFISFTANWSNFFLPFVTLTDPRQYTIQVGLTDVLTTASQPELALATLIAASSISLTVGRSEFFEVRKHRRNHDRDADVVAELAAQRRLLFPDAIEELFGQEHRAIEHQAIDSPVRELIEPLIELCPRFHVGRAKVRPSMFHLLFPQQFAKGSKLPQGQGAYLFSTGVTRMRLAPAFNPRSTSLVMLR